MILFEYSENYPMTSGNLWNYYRDEANDDVNKTNNAGSYRTNNKKTRTSKSLRYKTKIIGSTSAKSIELNKKFVVPLNYLNNFEDLLIYLWLTVK